MNAMNAKHVGICSVLLVALGLSVGALGCGPKEEDVYKAKPANTGRKASLPPVPTLPSKPKKQGDAYTVAGVTHDLRSRVHAEDVNGKKLTLVGYIVATNYDKAPACAVHKVGKADEGDCKSPIPSFAIADEKGNTTDVIECMGWASNFAQVYSLIDEIDHAPKGKEREVKIDDPTWGVSLPNPVPNVGAKVKVTGTYGVTFTKASGGAASNPKYGIMTVEQVEYLEPPPEKAYLPGMKPKK